VHTTLSGYHLYNGPVRGALCLHVNVCLIHATGRRSGTIIAWERYSNIPQNTVYYTIHNIDLYITRYCDKHANDEEKIGCTIFEKRWICNRISLKLRFLKS